MLTVIRPVWVKADLSVQLEAVSNVLDQRPDAKGTEDKIVDGKNLCKLLE